MFYTFGLHGPLHTAPTGRSLLVRASPFCLGSYSNSVSQVAGARRGQQLSKALARLPPSMAPVTSAGPGAWRGLGGCIMVKSTGRTLANCSRVTLALPVWLHSSGRGLTFVSLCAGCPYEQFPPIPFRMAGGDAAQTWPAKQCPVNVGHLTLLPRV